MGRWSKYLHTYYLLAPAITIGYGSLEARKTAGGAFDGDDGILFLERHPNPSSPIHPFPLSIDLVHSSRQ
jgi:hypothetical protein